MTDYNHQGRDVVLQRMRKGLPNTPFARLQELALAVVVQALQDDDDALIVGPDMPWFDTLLSCIGVDPETAFRIKIAYCRNELLGHFNQHSLNAPRREVDESSPVFPKSWGRLPQ